MREIWGKYGMAKVFTDVVDQSAISQVTSLLNQPYMEGCKVRMMPDIHAGAGCTVGTTIAIQDKICPNLVGGDIGCGMEVVRLRESEIDCQKLDRVIREGVPFGREIRKSAHPFAGKIDLSALHCARNVNRDKAYASIGTLGGGNHFIEANRDDEGHIYIVIHSGSRHLGKEVAKYYQEAAYDALTNYSKEEIDARVQALKDAGRHKEIERELKNLPRKRVNVSKELAYVEGELLQRYLHDMNIAQRFASLNRQAMMDVIVKGLGVRVEEQFTTIHNYIDVEHKILRKGAVSAQAGERLIIPINMRDGSLICTGRGNPDWNCSAPHGAGRLWSRSEAKQLFSVEEFKEEMSGIFTTSVGSSTLDECPMAYKRMADIVDNIGPTVEINAVIKPIYNFKASSEEG